MYKIDRSKNRILGQTLVLFYDVHKENMFTINLGDGREAPSKARKKGAKRLEFLVLYTAKMYM